MPFFSVLSIAQIMVKSHGEFLTMAVPLTVPGLARFLTNFPKSDKIIAMLFSFVLQGKKEGVMFIRPYVCFIVLLVAVLAAGCERSYNALGVYVDGSLAGHIPFAENLSSEAFHADAVRDFQARMMAEVEVDQVVTLAPARVPASEIVGKGSYACANWQPLFNLQAFWRCHNSGR